MDKEISNNVDLTYRFNTDDLNASFSIFHNQFDTGAYTTV
jgi:iron complex outermembrane receptor protein